MLSARTNRPPACLPACLPMYSPGCKTNNVEIIYTPWANLKKTQSMEVGQVGGCLAGPAGMLQLQAPPSRVSLTPPPVTLHVCHAHMPYTCVQPCLRVSCTRAHAPMHACLIPV